MPFEEIIYLDNKDFYTHIIRNIINSDNLIFVSDNTNDIIKELDNRISNIMPDIITNHLKTKLEFCSNSKVHWFRNSQYLKGYSPNYIYVLNEYRVEDFIDIIPCLYHIKGKIIIIKD